MRPSNTFVTREVPAWDFEKLLDSPRDCAPLATYSRQSYAHAMRHPDQAVRRSQRVLAMVHELHKLGYQRLRIMPGLSPSGGYWRCNITPTTNILRTHGAFARKFYRESAHYNSGMSNEYFGWQDATADTARQLAAKFVERFAAIAHAGRGRDWAYAGWYTEMLGFAERGELPIAYADWLSAPDPRSLPTSPGFESGLPMPPPGEAEPREDGTVDSDDVPEGS